MNCNNVVMVVVILLQLLTTGVAAEETQDPVTIDIGSFTESSTKRFDYTVIYAIGKTEVGGVPVRLQVDWFDNPNGLRRLWLNAGQFQVVKVRDVQMTFQPSLILANNGKVWVGGFLDIDMPKWKLSVSRRSYLPGVGNSTGKHITFVNWQVTKPVGIQYYLYTEKGWSPDSYIGPTVSTGPVYLWAGISTNRPGAWSVNSNIQWKF